MALRPRTLLAAALCSAALLAVPTLAQAPAAGSSASAAVPLPRTLPLRRNEPAAAFSLPSWLAGALLLAVLTAGGFAIVRRKGGGWPLGWKSARRAGGPITRLSSQALTPQASVHAIQWCGEELLLGCTAHQVTVLARRPLPADGEGA